MSPQYRTIERERGLRMNQSGHATCPLHANCKYVAAFTLIELSIVLVVIGLIVGGILVGQDMIRSATRRSIITDYEKIQVYLFNAFRGKYDCLPGDCVNATSIWGTGTRGRGCTRDGNTTTWQPSNGTCNGNGNGVIEYDYGGPINNEAYYFWQHLSLANLWPGSYLGDFPGGNPFAITLTVPGVMGNSAYTSAGIPNVAWAASGNAAGTTPYGMYYLNGGISTLGLGALCGGDSGNWCGGITPNDAYLIDLKLDDGVSSTSGLIFGGGVGATSCVTLPSYNGTGTYNTSVGSPVCTLTFLIKVE